MESRISDNAAPVLNAMYSAPEANQAESHTVLQDCAFDELERIGEWRKKLTELEISMKVRFGFYY